ncbi:probable LRR receptor-like serine/threonine-protein kinase At1g34110 [Helianthus annuus]|uniref:probable LRR receptor-like serine/threonine-protein kinase At1g34110 n=1 Tax=Helianthus annuus TaxID=4232 RepID=UPI000B8F9930|nr:probable LRR receptor-like serine/threonine-protein kinase At1g34110 [Helianthus annuus]
MALLSFIVLFTILCFIWGAARPYKAEITVKLLQSNRNLDWETRYKIAVGSAQGLAYIHQDCVPAILHRDVKCNNILLDCKYEAYLVDFGLAKLMNSANYQHAMSRVTGSYGYIAPEYGYTMNITEKSDVYSYRVVLLEILSGRSAVENRVREVSHIVEWVKKKMGSFEPTVTILDAKLQAGVDLP